MAKTRGLQLGSILIAAFSILLLGSILYLLTMRPWQRTPHRTACANGLRQLVTAMIAYRLDLETDRWPVTLGHGESASNAAAARRVTNRTFELLAARMQLPNRLFRCPATRHPAPLTKPEELGSGTWEGDASYAYDWAAPTDSASYRIILSDRSPTNHAGTIVMTAAADGSTRGLRQTALATSGHRTEDADRRPVTAVVPHADAGSDTIFDDLGDDEGGRYDSPTPSRGSPTRAWVK